MNGFFLYLFCTLVLLCLDLFFHVSFCLSRCLPVLHNKTTVNSVFLLIIYSLLFSSKTCHLVVDRAGERKLSSIFRDFFACLLMNLGLFLYLAICGRDSNLERFNESDVKGWGTCPWRLSSWDSRQGSLAPSTCAKSRRYKMLQGRREMILF